MHPFHPLFDQVFKLVYIRQNWGESRVYYLNTVGDLISIPACWTDVYVPDPFIVISAGRSLFRTTDLVQLVQQLKDMKG
ncbi:MAG: DUF5372 family protein [Gammaproteobacteria bacterium]|nr:DUF5372 family protein [Gammaproteobacteria bacterium]